MRAIDEELVRKAIGIRVEENARTRLAVASRAARLLVVGLQRAGHGVVNHEAYIRLVDAHAEGTGRDDHPRTLRHKGVLGTLTPCVVETRVIRSGVDAGVDEDGGDAFDRVACGSVYDRRSLGGAKQGDCRRILVGLAPRRPHVVRQVDAIEAGHDDFGIP